MSDLNNLQLGAGINPENKVEAKLHEKAKGKNLRSILRKQVEKNL